MTSNPISLQIIESSSVAPPPGTTPHCASLPFTYFDVVWISQPPVEWLFFYRYQHSTSHFLSSLLPSLKSSLSLALKLYHPLAGGFRRTPDTSNKFELYYVEGDAVSFTVAECNGQFEDLAGDHERDVSELNCLVPKLPNSTELQPLLAVQVAVFPDKGIVVGISVHHAACDGRSTMHFMHEWARTCLSGASVSSPVPSFDRTLISDPSNLYNFFYNFFYNQVQDMLKSAPKSGTLVANIPSDIILATFRLGKDQIQCLKQLFLSKAEDRGISFRCSTIVITYAYVWTGFVRAKCIYNTRTAFFGIAADFRGLLQPSLPMEYFGNCVKTCMAKANVADLMLEDGFITAAEAVGKAIDDLVSDRLKITKNWEDEYKTGMQQILCASGSPQFKVYDVDFGMGRPEKVEIVSAVRTSAMSLSDSRDEEGGVEIGIAFSKDEMDCFKKYFFDGLELISK